MVEHVYENSYQHDPGGTFVPCTCRPQQHYVPIPGPQSAQRTSLTIPMMKHERQAALGPDDSSRAVGHSERVFLDRGTRTETSYTPTRTRPRCRPPVPGHQPRRGRRRTAGTPATAGRSHACAPDSRRPVPRSPNPPHLRPVLVVEAGQDRDPLVPVQIAQPPGQLRPCPASAGEQKTSPSTANTPGAT